MIKSDTFANRLRQALAESDISAAELARTTGINKSSFTHYLKGDCVAKRDAVVKIAAVLGVSADWLQGYDTPVAISDAPAPTSKGKWIPVLGSVQAGIPVEAITDIIDYEEITNEMAATGEFFALRIRGQSMEPRMMEGDVVIVRRQEDADSGDICIVTVNGDDATVKKIRKGLDGLMLVPLNPTFEPMFYSNHDIIDLPVRILGKVVELRGKF